MADNDIVPLSAIDVSKRYSVTLAKPVVWNGHKFYPLDAQVFSGRVLLAVMQDSPDAIAASSAIV